MPAPRAARTAISVRRSSPLASSVAATLAQAISSTRRDGAEEQQQRLARLGRYQLLLDRHRHYANRILVVAVLPLELLADRLHFRRGARRVTPGFRRATTLQLCAVRPLPSGSSSAGIHTSMRPGKSNVSGITPTTRAVWPPSRSDSDARSGLPTKPRLPEAMADDDGGLRVGTRFVRGEGPAGFRRDAENAEEAVAHRAPLGKARLAAAEDRRRIAAVGRHRVEARRSVAPVDEVRMRYARGAAARVALAERDDAGGLAVRQRPQQHAVDDAEDRGVGADAERQRDHGDEREGGTLEERADAWRSSFTSDSAATISVASSS